MAANTTYYTFDYTGMTSPFVNGATAKNIISSLETTYPTYLLQQAVPASATLPYAVTNNQTMIDNLATIDTSMYAVMKDTFATFNEPLFGISMYNTEDSYSFFINVNSRYDHIVPMINNWVSNAILKSYNKDVKIRHSFSPLPETELAALQSQAFSLFWYSFFSIIGWSLIPTSAIAFVVKERESKSKYQQYISGVGVVS